MVYYPDDQQIQEELRLQTTINRQQLIQLQILETNFRHVLQFQLRVGFIWFILLFASLGGTIPLFHSRLPAIDPFLPTLLVVASFGLFQCLLNYHEALKNKDVVKILIMAQQDALNEAREILSKEYGADR